MNSIYWHLSHTKIRRSLVILLRVIIRLKIRSYLILKLSFFLRIWRNKIKLQWFFYFKFFLFAEILNIYYGNNFLFVFVHLSILSLLLAPGISRLMPSRRGRKSFVYLAFCHIVMRVFIKFILVSSSFFAWILIIIFLWFLTLSKFTFLLYYICRFYLIKFTLFNLIYCRFIFYNYRCVNLILRLYSHFFVWFINFYKFSIDIKPRLLFNFSL